MALAILAACLLSAIVAFLLGIAAAGHMELNKALRAAGMTKDMAKLYGRAVKIFKRLANLREFAGDFALDSLSPETERQVNEWLADHRKQVSK